MTTGLREQQSFTPSVVWPNESEKSRTYEAKWWYDHNPQEALKELRGVFGSMDVGHVAPENRQKAQNALYQADVFVRANDILADTKDILPTDKPVALSDIVRLLDVQRQKLTESTKRRLLAVPLRSGAREARQGAKRDIAAIDAAQASMLDGARRTRDFFQIDVPDTDDLGSFVRALEAVPLFGEGMGEANYDETMDKLSSEAVKHGLEARQYVEAGREDTEAVGLVLSRNKPPTKRGLGRLSITSRKES